MMSERSHQPSHIRTLTHAFAGVPGERLVFNSSTRHGCLTRCQQRQRRSVPLAVCGRGNTAYADAGSLDAYADIVNAASNIIQGRMQINTANSAGTLVERLRADGDGRVWIGQAEGQGSLMTLGPQLMIQRNSTATYETINAQGHSSGGDHMWTVMTARGTGAPPET